MNWWKCSAIWTFWNVVKHGKANAINHPQYYNMWVGFKPSPNGRFMAASVSQCFPHWPPTNGSTVSTAFWCAPAARDFFYAMVSHSQYQAHYIVHLSDVSYYTDLFLKPVNHRIRIIFSVYNSAYIISYVYIYTYNNGNKHNFVQ